MTDESDIECPECGYYPLEVKKSIEDNEVVEGGHYCPDCGTDYGEDTVLDWDNVDWPVWIHWESYNDSWDMYRRFLRESGLHEDVAGDQRQMKYTVFSVWFRIDKDGSVNGPFENKGDDEALNL